MRWRIYYGDYSTYDPSNGEAWDAPARNAQMIAVSDPNHGWYLCRSNDYYWYLPNTDEWQGGDIFGLWDYMIEPGPKKVLFGRTVSNEVFSDIFTKACSDPDIPQKTGWQPCERESAGIKE